MCLVSSTPFKWQITSICLGLVLVVLGFISLLLAIGLTDYTWKVLGVVCVSLGIALSLGGIGWCIWAVKRAKHHGDHCQILDCEVEILATDSI